VTPREKTNTVPASASCSCDCCAAPTLIFPCSGGSDVGEISDRAARQLTRTGVGRMYCLAGIGGQVSGILASTRAADRVLVIDGCPLNCAKRTLELAGITGFQHVCLSQLGLAKGASPADQPRVEQVAQHATEVLAQR
jgi:uncharacterized metal-binding protein